MDTANKEMRSLCQDGAGRPEVRTGGARGYISLLYDLSKILSTTADVQRSLDQVLALLPQYLSFLPREEKAGTIVSASAINNYVRLKVMPPPGTLPSGSE